MPIFTVRHTTAYRYRQPVGFGEHQLMLRPLESADQRLLTADLTITPEPASLHWWTDERGNTIGTARFRGRARSLCFRSTFQVEQTPWEPLHTLHQNDTGNRLDAWSQAHAPEFLRQDHPDPVGSVADWAGSFAPTASDNGLAALTAMTGAIRAGFTYRRREERGIQTPAETLFRQAGSCRDFSLLMMDTARALGIPARFVSGYLHVAADDPESTRGGGSTHAWVQAHLPETGWTDFDPTNGIVGNRGLIRVATAPDPLQVVPLSGTYIGFPADQLGMEVQVRVEMAEACARMPLRGVVV